MGIYYFILYLFSGFIQEVCLETCALKEYVLPNSMIIFKFWKFLISQHYLTYVYSVPYIGHIVLSHENYSQGIRKAAIHIFYKVDMN